MATRFVLVNPSEPRADGWRICNVESLPFGVAAPMFWTQTSDDAVVANEYYYKLDGTIVPMPQPDPPPEG